VTKWVARRQGPLLGSARTFAGAEWQWRTVVRRLLALLGVTLLLIGLSLAGSGSVVLA
jgi:hypothetical protein